MMQNPLDDKTTELSYLLSLERERADDHWNKLMEARRQRDELCYELFTAQEESAEIGSDLDVANAEIDRLRAAIVVHRDNAAMYAHDLNAAAAFELGKLDHALWSTIDNTEGGTEGVCMKTIKEFTGADSDQIALEALDLLLRGVVAHAQETSWARELLTKYDAKRSKKKAAIDDTEGEE